MSTNFYAQKIPLMERKDKLSEELSSAVDSIKKEMLDEIDRGNFHRVYRILENYTYDITSKLSEEYPKIHIGKRSGGWQFLWRWHDGKYWGTTLESIRKFLSQPDIIIFDENGDRFTVDEFLDDEIKDSIYKTEDNWNMEDYVKYEEETEHTDWSWWHNSHKDDEFTASSGLRFSRKEFS